MGLNNKGWTEIMEGNLPPGRQDSSSGKLLTGRAVLDIDGLKIDLGTLGFRDRLRTLLVSRADARGCCVT